MKDQWYGDNRDLVKWSALLHMADHFGAARVLQIAYYRQSCLGAIRLDRDETSLRPEVLGHFRDIQTIESIRSRAKISVFGEPFVERDAYLAAALQFISGFPRERCVVFLDPDTGLQPKKCKAEHVSDDEVRDIWSSLKRGDVLAFYQHRTNRNGQPWIEPKRKQLAEAIKVGIDLVGVASGEIANDVVIFYCQRL